MKAAIWNAVAIVSVAHMLALLGFIGFLGLTGRLSRERIHNVRMTFVETIDAEAQRVRAEEARAQREREEALRLARIDAPNPGVEARHEEIRTLEHVLRERLQRADRDLDALKQLLESRLREVEDRERRLALREQTLEAEMTRFRRLQSDEQFQRTVALLAGQKPDDLKAMLDVYLEQGRADYVVDLIEALPGRAATRVIAQYGNQDQSEVAADLLLRLRERGLDPATGGLGRN